MEAAVPGRCDEAFYSPERLRLSQLEAFIHGIHTQSPDNGVLDDPTGAQEEHGKKLLTLRVAALVEQIRKLEQTTGGVENA
jgi:creatinine amidohydrolase/Fe(II)-dependent formamide hydrolase-like protein